MTSSNGFASQPVTQFDPVRLRPSEVAAARRMIVKHVPEEQEIELRRMLGVHHD